MGRLGAYAPALGILLGAALPPLGAVGSLALLPSVALLLVASVTLAEPGRVEAREWPLVLGLAGANLLVAPSLVHLLAEPLGLGAATPWLVLMAGSPVAGGAVLLAGLLGLPLRPILLAQLLCFFALPVTAPLVASLLLGEALLDPGALLARVAVLVGLPALAGLALRRAMGDRRLAAARPRLKSLGALALTGIGLAAVHGLPALLSAPATLSVALPGVLLVSALGAALGLLVGLGAGARAMTSCALGGGVRNVSMIWGATTGLAAAEGSAILQIATVWVVGLPAVIALAVALGRASRASVPKAAGTR